MSRSLYGALPERTHETHPQLSADITVAMATKDSHSRLGAIFRSVLLAIKGEFRDSEFLLLDDSEDDTIGFVQGVLPATKVAKGAKTRGVARQLAIELTTSSWLMFVDDDCLIDRGWLEAAREPRRREKVGLIWGPYRKPSQASASRNTIRDFKRRGGTHDTLLRMSALSGIKIPYFLNWYEDAFIMRYVESRGFSSEINGRGCLHLSTGNAVWSKNLGANVENLYNCGRYMGLYRPNPLRALQIAATTFASPSEYRKRYRWFRYYTSLYRYDDPGTRRIVRSRDGLLWTLRPMMHDTLAIGEHEAWLGQYFAFARGETFLDIGAHVGKYSIRAAKAGCRVHSWEPNPENARVLLDNAKLNGVTVNLHEEALGEVEGDVSMVFCGANSFVTDSAAGQAVPTRRLDAYTFDRVDFVKVDAEGSDLRILKGARETLAIHHPRLVVETYDSAENLHGVKALLTGLGYDSIVVGTGQKYVVAKFAPLQ